MLLVKNWSISLAPLHSNIIWPNFFTTSFITTLKGILLNLLVLALALTFVTPVYLMEFLKKSGFVKQIEDLSKYHFLTSQIFVQLTPFVLVIANYIIIP